MRLITIPAALAATLILSMSVAHAGVMDMVINHVTGEVGAAVLTAIIGVLAVLFGSFYRKVANTLRETGEFLDALGTAVEDHQITRDEIGTIIREGKDLLKVWM